MYRRTSCGKCESQTEVSEEWGGSVDEIQQCRGFEGYNFGNRYLKFTLIPVRLNSITLPEPCSRLIWVPEK